MTTPPQPSQPPAGTYAAKDHPAEPILVRLVDGDDLKPFEQQSLDISRRTYWVAFVGLWFAFAAAVFVGDQVYEMTKQTQILASQSEGANAGALMDEMNTRRQLHIAQIQAKAAQDSVTAIRAQMRQDQRPMLKPGMGFAHERPAVGETINGSVTIQNVGKTPATQMKGFWYISIVQNGEKLRFRYPMNSSLGVTMGAIFPNDPPTSYNVYWTKIDPSNTTSYPTERKLTPEEFDSLLRGGTFFIIYGRVTYNDEFGVSHWTHFCSWTHFTQGQKTIAAQDCAAYNAIDHNR